MCYCIIIYTFRYRDLYIGRSSVDQCVHVLLNKYVLHQSLISIEIINGLVIHVY